MGTTSYAIALGSNRYGRCGPPAGMVIAATDALAAAGLVVTARSTIRATPPLGPAGRSFANAAVLVRTDLEPTALLATLKAIERDFGRRGGKRWGARTLDLDILLRFAGPSTSPAASLRINYDRGPVVPAVWLGSGLRRGTLIVPHPSLTKRDFVLQPLEEIAPGWRNPFGLTVRHLRARLRRAKPVAEAPRLP